MCKNNSKRKGRNNNNSINIILHNMKLKLNNQNNRIQLHGEASSKHIFDPIVFMYIRRKKKLLLFRETYLVVVFSYLTFSLT